MARFAAATVLVCAALLLCVEQSAGRLASADPLSTLFPANSLPPPVRIYCKQNTALNVAVRDDGKVVLAVSKFGEFKSYGGSCTTPCRPWSMGRASGRASSFGW
uniref:Uncharacterized protein n=1 Tax=Setaria viridis TaxID=4556 RepID=A0A4U6VIL2_SETVI|nr:hypothetical protein SEVIR_3G290250v2 [Setaria viridis]